jgi:hypothetical protein
LHRKIGAALARAIGFVANEITFAACGAPTPGDDDAFGSVEMFLDIFAPVASAADMAVPPDTEAFRFKRRDERQETGSVFGLVREEYVGRTDNCSPRNDCARRFMSSAAIGEGSVYGFSLEDFPDAGLVRTPDGRTFVGSAASCAWPPPTYRGASSVQRLRLPVLAPPLDLRLRSTDAECSSPRN